MKKLKYAASGILFLFVLIMVGPRVDESYEVKNNIIPDSVDEYLAQSESKYNDIRPETEKKVTWVNPIKKEKTPISIVYLHGYSASRKELYPVIDIIANELKANIFFTRLAGHGRTPDAMGDATVNDWINDAIEAIRIGEKIGEKVIIIGNSTGATLGAWLGANSVSNKVVAYVFYSPNFGPKDPLAGFALYPWGKQVGDLVLGKYRSMEVTNDGMKKYWTYKSRTSSTVTMMGLVDVVNRADLSKIKEPFLIVYSDKDEVVDPIKIKQRFNEIGSQNKKLIVFNESERKNHHVLAGDAMSPSTNEKVIKITLDFLNSIETKK